MTKSNWVLLCAVAAATCVGCSSFPAPTQRMADAESAMRAANEVGAGTQPAAQLHVRLAAEQIASARLLMNEGENQRADFVLLRAKADAELAVAIAREQSAVNAVKTAVETSNTTLTNNVSQGAVK